MSDYGNVGRPFTEENFRLAIVEMKDRHVGNELFVRPDSVTRKTAIAEGLAEYQAEPEACDGCEECDPGAG